MSQVLQPRIYIRYATARVNSSQWLTKRSIGMVLNKRNKHDSEGSKNESEGSSFGEASNKEKHSRIDNVSQGLANIFQGKQQPAVVDPKFEVVDSGYGSLVIAKMPAYSQFHTQVGQTLGQSPKVRSKAIMANASVIAALKPLIGRKMFVQEVATEESPADVIIAPKKVGDISIIGLDGSVDYFIRKGSVLASTKFLSTSTWKALGAGFSPFAFDKLTGRGTVVINAYAGLHRLVLMEGEEYLIDPRFVIAWSSTLNVQPQSGKPTPLSSTSASTHHAPANAEGTRPMTLVTNNPSIQNTVSSPPSSPLNKTQTVNMKTSTSDAKRGPMTGNKLSFATRIYTFGLLPVWKAVRSGVSSIVYASANAVRVSGWAAAKVTKTIAGVPDLYRVTGPGEIYISTRLAPRPWTRAINNISAKSN